MRNDNGSYWKGYLGYPAIVFLQICQQLSDETKRIAQELQTLDLSLLGKKTLPPEGY